MHVESFLREVYSISLINLKRLINYRITALSWSSKQKENSIFKLFRSLNKLLHIINLHCMPWSYRLAIEKSKSKYTYTPVSKYLALITSDQVNSNTSAFEWLYKNLEDQYSKDVLEWFIKVRTSYALLGEMAFDIYPNSFHERECSNLKDFNKICSKKFKITFKN